MAPARAWPNLRILRPQYRYCKFGTSRSSVLQIGLAKGSVGLVVGAWRASRMARRRGLFAGLLLVASCVGAAAGVTAAYRVPTLAYPLFDVARAVGQPPLQWY